MFNQQDLNKRNDFTFAFLEVRNSNRLLGKLSLQRGDNSKLNCIPTEYTIVNPCKSVRFVSSVFHPFAYSYTIRNS